MGPNDRILTNDEILEQEEIAEILSEEDFLCNPIDEYDDEIDNALLEEERALLNKYGF